MSRAALLSLLAGMALIAGPAGAHETLHEVVRGKAIAVRAYFADGEALAYAAYEIYSPVDPKIPYQKGRTDRRGWLAFVPDADGQWRVKVIDSSGHGLDIQVPEGPVDHADASASKDGAAPSPAAFVLRPLVGLALIAAIFAALALAYRKKEAKS